VPKLLKDPECLPKFAWACLYLALVVGLVLDQV